MNFGWGPKLRQQGHVPEQGNGQQLPVAQVSGTMWCPPFGEGLPAQYGTVVNQLQPQRTLERNHSERMQISGDVTMTTPQSLSGVQMPSRPTLSFRIITAGQALLLSRPKVSSGQSAITVGPQQQSHALVTPLPILRESLNTSAHLVSDQCPRRLITSAEKQPYILKFRATPRSIEPISALVMEHEKGTDKADIVSHGKRKLVLDVLTQPKGLIPVDRVVVKDQNLPKSINNCNEVIAPLLITQPLLDAVVFFSKHPNLRNLLSQAFGPTVEVIKDRFPIEDAGPPPSKKKKVDKNERPYDLPNILQGEIVLLANKFIISVDPGHDTNSGSYHLVCKLEDIHLPSVPPILVTVSRTYPRSSPRCDPENCPGYDGSVYLQNVRQNLLVHLSHLPNRFCLTQLLGAWEMSVRKACDPVHPLIVQPNPVFI